VKGALRSVAPLAGLWALGIAQPLFDVLSRAPEFFIAHRADALDEVVLAVMIALAGPIVLLGLVRLAGAIDRRLVGGLTLLAVTVLGAVLAVQVAYRVGASGWAATLVVGAASAAAFGVAWVRLGAFRTFLRVLSPAAFVVPLVFLLSGPLRAAFAAGDGASGTAAGARATPVAVVVFDELSLVSLMDTSGHINAKRYPNIARLAADGVWFRNATAVSDYTRWALPSILTGRYPSAQSTPTPRDHPNTLFSLVGRSHRLRVLEPVTAICPRELCRQTSIGRFDRLRAILRDLVVVGAHVFLPPSERADLPNLSENWAGFFAEDDGAEEDEDEDGGPAPRLVARRRWQQIWRGATGVDHLAAARSFIDEIGRDQTGQPTLYFMHALATHHPARWLPNGQRIANRRGIPGTRDGVWTDAEWLVAQHHHGHLMQAGLADGLVGRLIDRLKSAGMYDEALVIVTADHGISFRAGDRLRAFSPSNAVDLASVPFIVKLPAGVRSREPGTIDDANVETIDVLPTVADVLDAGIRWDLHGRSVIEAAAERPAKRFHYEFASRRQMFRTDEIVRRRDEAVRRQTTLFGEDAWPVFTLPELRGLIGQEVEAFGVMGETSLQLSIDNESSFDRVDVNAPESPAQLTGRIRGPAGETARVAVAVALNGRIVATTRRWPSQSRWMAMLPPGSLQAGRNTVDAFIVDPARPDQLQRPRQ
jgi:hypothetical protein